MLDDVEGVFDIFLTEYEEDYSLDVWMKMKSSDPISEIDWLGAVDPVDDESSSLSDIVDHDRYECADHHTSEEEHDDIDSYECQPWRDSVTFSEVDEGIHDEREESCYQDECDYRWEHPEDIESGCDYEDNEDFFGPEDEFAYHSSEVISMPKV